MKTYENKTIEFIYQETAIHFLLNPKDKDVMINATEMAKLFGKRTGNYLTNKETKKLIKGLKRTGIPVQIIDDRGRNGIYFCEILALDFAAWLDVDFKIWIYTTIRDLLQKDFKKIKSSVAQVSSKEKELRKLVTEIQNSDNEEAKKLLIALADLETAKKTKTKAIGNLTKQIKMEFA